MADIQIPNRQSGGPQFQGAPVDLINTLYNRPKPTEILADTLNRIVNQHYERNLQQQDRKIQGVGALADLYGNGGEWLANKLGPQVAQASGIQFHPDDPYGTIQASVNAGHGDPMGMYPQQGQSQAPQTGGAVPSNASSAPQASAQTLPASPSQPGLQGVQGIQDYIASHPGIGGKVLNTQVGLAKGIGELQMMPLTAAQKQLEMQKTQNELALQPTQAELTRQQLENARQQIPMEKAKAVTAATEKVAPNMAAIKLLQSTYDQITKLNSDPSNKSIPGLGNLGAKYAEINPNTKSKWALNQSNAEGIADVGAGAIEKLVEGRYNEQQKENIKKSFFPTGNVLGTPLAKQRLARLQNYITQARQGNIDQVKAAIDSIAGGGEFNPEGMGKPEQGTQVATGPHGPTVRQNGHTYTWNSSKGQYE